VGMTPFHADIRIYMRRLTLAFRKCFASENKCVSNTVCNVVNWIHGGKDKDKWHLDNSVPCTKLKYEFMMRIDIEYCILWEDVSSRDK
jgi:hypothetical protein